MDRTSSECLGPRNQLEFQQSGNELKVDETPANPTLQSPQLRNCENCDESSATVGCIHCKAIFCESCKVTVHTLKFNRQHEQVSLKEYDIATGKAIHPATPTATPSSSSSSMATPPTSTTSPLGQTDEGEKKSLLHAELRKVKEEHYPSNIPGFFDGPPTFELNGTFFFGKHTMVRNFEKGNLCFYHFYEGMVAGNLSFVVGQELNVNLKATTVLYCLGYLEKSSNKALWIFVGEQKFTATREHNRLLAPTSFRRRPAKITLANPMFNDRRNALLKELIHSFDANCTKAETTKPAATSTATSAVTPKVVFF